MAGFISNILWNSVEGFVEAGTRTAGGYAGDALIKAGDLIEGGGRKVGGGLERTASNYGQKISGQSYQSSSKGLPSTGAKKTAVTPKRSNSMPASTKAGSNRAKAITAGSSGQAGSKVPIGGNKYPGGKGIPGGNAATSAQKKITSGVSGVGRGVTGGVVGGTAHKAASTSGSGARSLPKPYTPSVNSTANSYANPFPSGEKKTAVKPGGKSKPFNPSSASAAGKTGGGGAMYPGTNTPVGAGKKTPVRAQKYKPLERMSGVAEKGKVQHIGAF